MRIGIPRRALIHFAAPCKNRGRRFLHRQSFVGPEVCEANQTAPASRARVRAAVRCTLASYRDPSVPRYVAAKRRGAAVGPGEAAGRDAPLYAVTRQNLQPVALHVGFSMPREVGSRRMTLCAGPACHADFVLGTASGGPISHARNGGKSAGGPPGPHGGTNRFRLLKTRGGALYDGSVSLPVCSTRRFSVSFRRCRAKSPLRSYRAKTDTCCVVQTFLNAARGGQSSCTNVATRTHFRRIRG